MTAEYPTKVTTQLRDAVARLKTILTDDIAQGVATIPVAATAGFPEKGFITIDNETKEYTGTTAYTFTGCSNLNGNDVAHEKDAEVRCTISAAHINRLNEELIAVQTALGITGAFNFVNKTLAESIAGIKTFSDTPKMDAIAEKTATSGVTIDGVLLKDDLDTSGIVGKTTTQTLTNKRITKRFGSTASSATPTPSADYYDMYMITALAEAATFGVPSGTPTGGQTLLIRIKDNGTARALSWNAIYRAGTDIALPTTTVISKTMYVLFIYNSTDTKWDLLAFIDNI